MKYRRRPAAAGHPDVCLLYTSRFFLRTTFGQAVKNLNDHYENIRIVHGEKKKDRLSLYNLLSETVNQNSKDKKPSPQLAGALARAVLELSLIHI